MIKKPKKYTKKPMVRGVIKGTPTIAKKKKRDSIADFIENRNMEKGV